jgi:hypothetical protein
MAPPGATVAVQGEEEKREHHLIDFVFVVVRGGEMSVSGCA